MSLSVPTRLQKAFALSGSKNTIPVASQIGITPGAASYTDGFPPLTRTPIAAGGVPPFGEDMNGVLFDLSAAVQWNQAGGLYRYDSTFSTAVGGYPKGAIVLLNDDLTIVKSTVANNTGNPNSSMTGWVNMISDLAGGPGWQTLPGGKVIQMGSAVVAAANTLELVSFPVAFPSGLTPSYVYGSSNSVNTYGGAVPNNATSLYVFAGNTGASVTFLAIGS